MITNSSVGSFIILMILLSWQIKSNSSFSISNYSPYVYDFINLLSNKNMSQDYISLRSSGRSGLANDIISSITDGTAQNVVTTTTQKPLPICGVKKIRHKELIVNGMGTVPGEWPWHAAVYKIRKRQSNYMCGGTLLSQTRILTAGHCVVENGAKVLPERLFVVLGKYELIGSSTNIQDKAVHEIILHPNFERNPLKNDIAILKLVSMLTYTPYVQPVCLWTSAEDSTKENLYGKYGHIVGWGFTGEDELATELKSARLPVITELTCLRSNPNFFGTYLTNNTFCVGENNGVNACNGDSGGGYFFSKTYPEYNNQEVWFVRGIVSLSVSREDLLLCDPKEYTLFTDVNRYMTFINSNL